ncbi:hypothetical protein KGQ19_47275 [Catenulispora sp. NL8]|uniref:Uncharacterized protein n=1 Tax=Catenulispora pinistramenti TaxID=2705254 RepID=A0ABS5L7Y9_9ACTN|nr:hypothetical protein [Catenulispora pinistramenti]MBS2554483.1 hypothetical protein [Catenulispora pinistramenti]
MSDEERDEELGDEVSRMLHNRALRYRRAGLLGIYGPYPSVRRWCWRAAVTTTAALAVAGAAAAYSALRLRGN